MNSPAEKSTRQKLLFIALLALVLRIGFSLVYQGHSVSADERHWDALGVAFWQEGLLSEKAGTYRPPLYPLLMAITYSIGDHQPMLIEIWQALLWAATCALAYEFARRCGGEQVGLLAAGGVAFYPFFIFLSSTLMAESLLIFLSSCALVLAMRLEENPVPRNAVLLGAVLGLGGLCKPVLLAWVPLLLWGWWRRAEIPQKNKLASALICLAAMMLVIAPWTGRNMIATGYPVPISTNLGINLLIGHEAEATGSYRDDVNYLELYDQLVLPERDPVLRDRIATRTILGQMAADPLRTVELGLHKVLLLWSPTVTGESGWRNGLALLSSGPLLLLGLAGMWQLRGSAAGWIVASLVLSLTAVHILIFSHTRFRLPIDAALMGPAALSLVEVWRRRT